MCWDSGPQLLSHVGVTVLFLLIFRTRTEEITFVRSVSVAYHCPILLKDVGTQDKSSIVHI